MKKFLVFLSCIAVALFLCTPSHAADFDFSGTFTQDNDVLLLDFTVGAPSTITIFSSSWDDGGFDPILAIWDASGNLESQQDDGGNTGSTLSNSVSYDHGTWDSYYDVFLSAGNYSASITQYDNFANGSNLSAGFRYDDNPNFTFDEGYGGGTQPYFNGVWDSDDPRTGDWVFHVLNVAQASQQQPNGSVPEPATMLLLGSGLIGLGVFGRKRLLKK